MWKMLIHMQQLKDENSNGETANSRLSHLQPWEDAMDWDNQEAEDHTTVVEMEHMNRFDINGVQNTGEHQWAPMGP